MDRAYKPEFNEFQDVEFSQYNRPMHPQMNFQNRQSLTHNRYTRYDVDEVDGYYDQLGCEGYNDFVPPPQPFIQKGQNRVNLSHEKFNNAQQNSYGRSSGPTDSSNNEIMEMLKQMKKDLELRAEAYQALDKQVAQLVVEVKEVTDSRDQDNYESNWQTQENEQMGQHESDDNSYNEKFDTIMELLKDIQKGNEVRDREVKVLSQQVGHLAEEVVIIRKNQDKLLSDCQKNPIRNSSHTSVHINEVSTPSISKNSTVETQSPQHVEVMVEDVTESGDESERDQEIGSFKKSKHGSNKTFSDSDNGNVKVPFPMALLAPKNLNKQKSSKGESWEKFEKVKINQPLLEKIKESPDHVEFFEELSTRKRRHKFPKQLDIVHVNAVLMGTLPPKLQDPGAPIISIQIGDFKLDRALLDLGACVSILPGSLYDQYDFGPLQEVETIVVLADQTPTCPRGIVKDVIVKVGEFYYPVDFLVLDCVKNNQPTVILGRPFLATAHAVIHCIEGTVMFRFGDQKSILKVFSNLTKPVANKCEPSEKKSRVDEKECFMIDRLVEVKKKKKKSRRSRRKKRKEAQKMNGEKEKCELNSCWLLNKLDGVSKLWMNRLMKMRDCKHPTRPP